MSFYFIVVFSVASIDETSLQTIITIAADGAVIIVTRDNKEIIIE